MIKGARHGEAAGRSTPAPGIEYPVHSVHLRLHTALEWAAQDEAAATMGSFMEQIM